MNYELELIDLTLPKEGFREFISSWILNFEGKIYVVDPGPKNSLPILYKALGSRKPDYCLLTHIHIDHAGGIGSFVQNYPQTKVIAAENSHKHLINPTKLIEGSTRTLGDLMNLYGEILPIPEASILKETPACLEIISTPGHAAHHISYVISDLVFCGEALGVRHSGTYLRPATPIKFDLDSYTSSIKKLSHLENVTLCFGHYGSMQADQSIYQNALEQIELWLEIIKNNANSSLDEIFEILKSKDSLLKDFDNFPNDIKNREKIFIGNSINGILDYCKSRL